jgi:hypothetical protein
MRLFTKAQSFGQQPRLRNFPLDDVVNVLASTQIEDHWYEIGMGDAFSTARWIITTNGHPDNLAVSNSGDGTDVTFDHFKNHFGAEIEDAIATESRKLPAQSLSKGVSQGFLAH